MRQRTSGRPSGTDGSDFSYRMVVDSRYTKAARDRSRLATLLLIQTFIQLIGLLITILLISTDKDLDVIATSSYATGLIFLLIGELGRRKSRASLLQLYMSFSTFTIIMPLLRNVTNSSILEDIGDYTNWNLKNFKFVETSMLMLGLVAQLITILVVTSLIGNISLPKKTS